MWKIEVSGSAGVFPSSPFPIQKRSFPFRRLDGRRVFYHSHHRGRHELIDNMIGPC
jgi:hypothetical protein